MLNSSKQQLDFNSNDIFFESLCKRPESLSNFLPFDEYLEDGRIFLNKDGSFGALFKINLIEHEPLVTDKIIEYVDSLNSWFNFDERFVLQIHYEQAYLSKLDKQWDKLKNSYSDGNSVSLKLYEKKIKQYRNSTQDLGQFSPFRRNAYLSLRFFSNNKLGSNYKEYFKSDNEFLTKKVKDFLEELRGFKYIVEQLKDNSKIELIQLDAEKFLDFYRRFFNPKTYYNREFAKYNPNTSLSKQVLYNSPTLSYEGIEREGVKSRTFTLKTPPQYAYAGGMSNFLKLNFPFRISSN